jgi:hypothetical protein
MFAERNHGETETTGIAFYSYGFSLGNSGNAQFRDLLIHDPPAANPSSK